MDRWQRRAWCYGLVDSLRFPIGPDWDNRENRFRFELSARSDLLLGNYDAGWDYGQYAKTEDVKCILRRNKLRWTGLKLSRINV